MIALAPQVPGREPHRVHRLDPGWVDALGHVVGQRPFPGVLDDHPGVPAHVPGHPRVVVRVAQPGPHFRPGRQAHWAVILGREQALFGQHGLDRPQPALVVGQLDVLGGRDPLDRVPELIGGVQAPRAQHAVERVDAGLPVSSERLAVLAHRDRPETGLPADVVHPAHRGVSRRSRPSRAVASEGGEAQPAEDLRDTPISLLLPGGEAGGSRERQCGGRLSGLGQPARPPHTLTVALRSVISPGPA